MRFFVITRFLVVASFLLGMTSEGKVHAINMESTRFIIESANTSSAAGDKSSSGYKLSDTIGQLAAGQFSSSGYVVKAGFQYLHSVIPFRFSISDINIDLGSLLPNTPSTAYTVLTVAFGSAGQYQVTTIEESPLKTLSGNAIVDTSCNGGTETCTESTAKLWDSASAYGFGYNMAGNDIPADFTSSSHFRPFPDRLLAEAPAVIMSSSNVSTSRQATLTFKANISPIQPAGSYQTVVSFVATPSY
ncbi:MAG: hypothetical protein UR68_C0006G0015 [Candidatus Roizmanbacteria bacterium GW2011_GWA2_35_19]|uniref:Uncharacterized protein n=2 Tax=Candidatus Roizmaniibacteriota TaxID=1752723 RepID=A0A0G0BV91_9BACT|nr:MAG: hypothetical protein UR63_C0015G0014 [Candidatus Roizmanbacteria bacterium GW2011_GWC2_35_12]KKP73198.1 MAG: hypothetical protein UR68_C0006G0015 [Candidatus Roizmanbacteria bacterium GW2011_GWA2_35_19]